jgi:fructoselysine-6-P-deglycase FrlB-like protein
MTFVEAEIASQPDCWRRAVEVARTVSGDLGVPGERIALVGCGTSWFVGQVAAGWREAAGLGETDAFTA